MVDGAPLREEDLGHAMDVGRVRAQAVDGLRREGDLRGPVKRLVLTLVGVLALAAPAALATSVRDRDDVTTGLDISKVSGSHNRASDRLVHTIDFYDPVVPADTIPATATTLPFFKYLVVNFAPWLFVVFVTVVITGSSNAVNLTDGLDGLATGFAGIAAAAFAVFAYLFGRVDVTTYLNVFYLPGAGELAVFCAALMGATIGFLWFNAHPAEVFMGDTGSLAIGGALGTVAILLKAEFLLLLIGGVFAAEAISVLVQTGTYKWFKRTRGREYADAHRVFRMAPLHHHFEKLGWAETTVVTRFYILGLLCALVALSTLKVR